MRLTGRSRTCVENGDNLRACFLQGMRGQIGVVIIRGNHNTLAGAYTKAPNISPHGL